MKPGYRIGVAALAAGLLSLPAGAQSADPYAECAVTQDDAARLACFDTTYARERETQAERTEMERERSAAEFGLTPMQIREREEELVEAGSAAADSPDLAASAEGDGERLAAQVADAFTDGRGRPVVLLANGQLWAATSSGSFRGTVRPQWHATITRSWSGGYRMTFDERRGFLSVKRLR